MRIAAIEKRIAAIEIASVAAGQENLWSDLATDEHGYRTDNHR
jgi:hypothetical protein